MIKMTDCTFEDSKKEHTVTFTYNDDLKQAKCSCSHEWTPKHLLDYKCDNEEVNNMKTLEDFNKERMCAHTTTWTNEPVKNGIACPECNSELMDSDPCVTLCSNPPKKRVKCSECDFVGFRVS